MSPDRENEALLDAPLPPGRVHCVQVEDKPVACFGTPEGTFAVVDFCPHRGGPLSEGTLSGTEITCPWHGSRFDLRTGEVLDGPATRPLQRVPVRYRSVKS